MNNALQSLKDKFLQINSAKGDIDFNDDNTWYKSHRSGVTGIGKTFEDLLGKTEDNKQLPDYKGIELKAHDEEDNGLITLFTKSPNLPRGINTQLRETYGYSEDKSNIKTLHTTIPSNKMAFNSKSNHYFKIVNDKNNDSIKIAVYDEQKNLIENGPKAQWSYEVLHKSITSKLSTLAIIETKVKKIKGKTYYNYDNIYVTHITLDTILNALDNGDLKVDLRLGAYKSGKNLGKTHDHGTGFRITLDDLRKYAKLDKLI